MLAVAIFNHYNRVRANMKRQHLQQQKQQREREIVAAAAASAAGESDERIPAEHHHPTLPQGYYSTQLPLQNHNSEFPPVAERATISYGK